MLPTVERHVIHSSRGGAEEEALDPPNNQLNIPIRAPSFSSKPISAPKRLRARRRLRPIPDLSAGRDNRRPCEEDVSGEGGPCAPPCRSTLRQAELIAQKLVGMLRFDPKGRQQLFGKILQILRHDRIAASDNSCCKHMAVVLIRQRQGRDQVGVAFDQAIAGVAVHQLARAFEAGWVSVRFIAKQRRHPFLMDLCRPFGAVNTHNRQLE